MGKKNFIGLSILLLVLLLGLSSICYADTNNTWTVNQLKNVFYKYMQMYSGKTNSEIEDIINYHQTEIETLVTKMNNSNYVYILFQQSGPSNFFIGYGNTNSTWYDYNGQLSMTNSSGYKYYVMPPLKSAGWENDGYYSFSRFSTNLYYFSKDIMTGSNTGIIKYIKGSKPTDLLTNHWSDDHFDFDYNMNQTFKDIIVGNDTYTLPIRQQGDNTLITLGELEQLKYLDYIMFEKMRYNKYTNMWETFYAENLFSGDWGTDDDILTVKVGGGNIGNILCQYTFYSNSNSFDDITAFYYVINLQTTYSGDVIDVSGIFGNDDYYNNYDDNINNVEQNQQAQDRTDDIINTITDDSKVDSMLGDFASGDIGEKMGYVEHSLPNVPDERNPSLLVMNLVNDFCDILIDDDNPYWDYSMHGETPTRIYASDFVTEETPLKVFIRLSMIFGSLFLIYIQFKHIIELINEGNAPKVLHDIDADVYFYKM